MADIANQNLDYDRPIRIAEDVSWVGVFDTETGWLSSPYLIHDNDEAVLIDAGSRSDFASVIIKIMQIGIVPSTITALIYQNYNPQLWGSLNHLETIIDRQNLKVISDQANLLFIKDQAPSGQLFSLDELGHEFRFSSGRRLVFINTPFAHAAGSFMTFDEKSGILFSGDLFSSYTSQWSLLFTLHPECRQCTDFSHCAIQKPICPLSQILKFHKNIMSSQRALKLALDRMASVPFKVIAPQHGSIIHNSEDIVRVCDLLSSLEGVGIDGIIGDKSFHELGNTDPIKDRLLGVFH